MKDHFFKATLTQILASFLIVAALAACSDNSTTTASTTTPPVPNAAAIALGTSTNWILTDNANSATLTATLVDASNAVMQGIPVSFSTTSGNLNASTATTDANGQATVTLKSGVADFTNRTATITASVGGLSSSIPILIKGSTLDLTLSPSNSIQVGVGTIDVTATAAGASGLGKSGQTIRFSIGAASTGTGTLSATTLVTDAAGIASPLVFTPVAAGTVVLTAEWLDTAGAATVTTTKDIIVTPALGPSFAVMTPAADPAALSSGATQALVVTVPATIAGTAVANVRISSTSGTWVGASPATGSLSSILQTPSAGAVAATYTAPSNSGSVTVQVDALDASGVALSSLSRTFVISAPSSAANKLYLASSAATIVPSSGGNISTATLKVTVRDANYNAVGGAAVMFGLLGTTGSGESVSPAVVLTDSNGIATTTFSAGSSATLAAIYAQASIVGETCFITSQNLPPAIETNNLCDTTPLMVSAAAVSVTVGFGTKIEETALFTQYKLPGSVMVVDSNGSPVAGATVTLSAFPVEYRNGEIMIGRIYSGSTYSLGCTGPFDTRKRAWDSYYQEYLYFEKTSFTAAEDINRNGIIDAGEDTQGNGIIDTWGVKEDTNNNGILDVTTEDVNGNGILDAGEDLNGNSQIDVTFTEDVNNNGLLDANTEDENFNGVLEIGEDIPLSQKAQAAQAISFNGLLSPPQAAGGTVPQTVTTDSNGAATFYLQYPKSSAWFINDEVTARVIVMGTESTAKTTLILPMLDSDVRASSCPLARKGSY